MGLDLVPLLLAFVVGLAAVELTIRRSDVGAGVILGLLVLQESRLLSLGFSVGGGTNVYPGDLVFLLLFTAALARLLRGGTPTRPQLVLLGFALLVAWSLARGIGEHGLNTAVNEARRYLTFTGTALYFSTVEPRQELLDRIAKLWVYAALALATLTLLRWVGNAVGLTGAIFVRAHTMRVIPSPATLVLAQGALLGIPALRAWTVGWWRYLTPTLVVLVLLLQHRTVWIVTAGAALYLLFRAGALEPRVLGALSAGVALLGVLVFTVFDEADVDVADQLATSASQTDTFEWRVTGWQVLIDESGPRGPLEQVAGRTFGSGWDRPMNDTVIEVSPHNFYLETYLRTGVAGVAGLVLLYGLALRGTRRTAAPLGGLLTPEVLTALVGLQLVYFITYTPDGAQSLLLGLGCAVAATARRAAPPVPRALELR